MATERFTCRVIQNQPITPTVFLISFVTDTPLLYEAGQWLSVLIPQSPLNPKDLRRAYSIASSPEQKEIQICYKIVEGGPGTSYLSALKPGDALTVFAPYGRFVYKENPGCVAVFIATGTGISPMRSMVLSKKYQDSLPPRSICLLGVRDEHEVLFENEFKALSSLEWIPCVSRPSDAWSGFNGRVTDCLRAKGSEIPWAKSDFYICGNSAMIEEVKDHLMRERGVEKSSIHTEIYYKG